MIHDIDLVLDLVAAPVADVQAFGVGILGNLEDCAQARITFANGSVADLTANRVSPVTSRRMQVWGPEGFVQLDFGSREVVRYCPAPALRFGSGPLEKARQKGADLEKLKADIFGTYIEVHKPNVVPRDQLTEELLEFTACVRTRKLPLVSGEVGLQAMLVAGRILDQVASPPWTTPGIAPRRQAG
jgi:predicted dehydrogenase